MKISVNGSEEVIEETAVLLDFLISKGLEPEKIVVEYNNEIIKRDEWSEITLKENDRLEVLRFVGGG